MGICFELDDSAGAKKRDLIAIHSHGKSYVQVAQKRTQRTQQQGKRRQEDSFNASKESKESISFASPFPLSRPDLSPPPPTLPPSSTSFPHFQIRMHTRVSGVRAVGSTHKNAAGATFRMSLRWWGGVDRGRNKSRGILKVLAPRTEGDARTN